jgi:chromosome segregation ATPase
MFFPRLAVLIGGVAAGALARRWQAREAAAPALHRSLNQLARELKWQVAAHAGRLRQLEARVEAQEAKLKELPSTVQIVAAMDELLAKAMSPLERRLTAQAQSIETLQMTVSQTDELLERVLESLDTLRGDSPSTAA